MADKLNQENARKKRSRQLDKAEKGPAPRLADVDTETDESPAKRRRGNANMLSAGNVDFSLFEGDDDSDDLLQDDDQGRVDQAARLIEWAAESAADR